MDQKNTIEKSINENIRIVDKIQEQTDIINQAAEIIISSFKKGNSLFLCGNGGSAADAQHLAAEFTGKFKKDRKPLPAQALNINCSSITAIGNDYSFDHVFSRELEAHAQQGDVLIAISTSGNSPNILEVAKKAKDMDVIIIGMTGQNGGILKEVADYCICVPSDNTPRIQEMHIMIGHIICEAVENSIFL